MVRDRVLPDQIHNYAHNQEWMVRNLVHLGRVGPALDLAKNLVELPRHPKFNTPAKAGRSAAFGRTRLFQVLEQFERWDDVLALADTAYLEPTDLPAEQVKRLRLLGLAHAGKGDRDRLGGLIAELERRLPGAKDADRKAKDKPDDTEYKGDEKEEKPRRNVTQTAEDALRELRGYAALLAGDGKAALALFGKVRGLDKTTLSRLHRRAGEPARAEELARQAVKASPNEMLPLANLVEVLHGAGKAKEAAEQFDRLRRVAGHADRLDEPPFCRLAPVAEALKLPADWRLPAAVAKDVGERPDLDRIGPFRWYPPAAPEWSLSGADGQKVSLAQYRGRPVVVLFYLGHGCSHCVEQLNRFAPKAEAFAAAGISLVAVSTDGISDLGKARPAGSKDGEFPFPLVSDAGLTAFKAYRAYDDFEGRPLHGTFLIDGAGRVRWQDVGHEPFRDDAFLLREARRLLQMPAGPRTLP
jgi:peroxiredoxin